MFVRAEKMMAGIRLSPCTRSIQERCRKIGFDNLAPIIWHKISNAAYEVEMARVVS